MKRYIGLTFFVLISSISGYCQDRKTIFEFGKPLTSCECNFENLFANWGPQFVTNYDDIELVSWNFVETLSDTSRVDFYIRKISDIKSVFQKTERKQYFVQEGGTLREIREFRIYPFFLEPRPDYPEKLAQQEIYLMCAGLKMLIGVGDNVFSIKIKYKDMEYDFDVFCRPGENEIIFDKMGFMGIYELTSY